MLQFHLPLESLVAALDVFCNETKPLGLQVSWTETKIQDLGTCSENLFSRCVLAARTLISQKALHILVVQFMSLGLSDQEVSRLVWQQGP